MRVFAGEQKSPCATPCRTFHTSSKFLSSVEERTDDSFRVKIFLVPEIGVTITDFVKPTISSMLSEVDNVNLTYFIFLKTELSNSIKVGGSMGLWLGLGVVQTIQLFSKYIFPLLCRRPKDDQSIKVAS